MHVYAPAQGPGETYGQGYWHAVLASILYLLGSLMLMVNMLGYFGGHYPQHFDLDDDQRTLILQTMMYFFWLASGAAIFSKIEGWSFPDALYYSDVVSARQMVGQGHRANSPVHLDDWLRRHLSRHGRRPRVPVHI